MAERKKIRFISPEPELAKALRRLEEQAKIKLLPEEYRDWLLTWIEDIGAIMRSRSYMASTAALYISMGIITLPFQLFPTLREFKLVSRVLGVR